LGAAARAALKPCPSCVDSSFSAGGNSDSDLGWKEMLSGSGADLCRKTFASERETPSVVWQIINVFWFVLGPAPFFCCFAVASLGEQSGWGICGSSAAFYCSVDVLICQCIKAGTTAFLAESLISSTCLHQFFRTKPQSDIGQTRGK